MKMSSSDGRQRCLCCAKITKYRCIKCFEPVCNLCATFEQNEETIGWSAGASVGYCNTCHMDILNKELNDQASPPSEEMSTNIPSENSHVPSSVQSSENDEDTNNNVEVPKKKKSGRKAQWSEYVLNDFIDIVASSEYYQRKLIFTNTKHQQNGPIYGKILDELKERANKRGEVIIFTVQQLRNKFKRCISECKQVAMTIKTGTGIKRFQDEKGYGTWFNILFPLVKSRDSCQPELAVEPSSTNGNVQEPSSTDCEQDAVSASKNEGTKEKLFIPIKKRKISKKDAVVEAVELLKCVVEQDPAKDLMNFMREEADKARKHELELIKLMLNNANSVPCNPQQGYPTTFPATNQAYNSHEFYQPAYSNFQHLESSQFHTPASSQCLTPPPSQLPRMHPAYNLQENVSQCYKQL